MGDAPAAAAAAAAADGAAAAAAEAAGMAAEAAFAGDVAGLDEAVVERMRRNGQLHLLRQLHTLADGSEKRQQLLRELQGIDYDRVCKIFRSSTQACSDSASQGSGGGAVEPLLESEACMLAERSADSERRWREAGCDAIAQGRLGVLLLAGGQGTRLGSSAPKGCYDIGLPSCKPLFQLHAERLLRMQQLCSNRSNGSDAASSSAGSSSSSSNSKPTSVVQIPWYIMTSPFTHDATVAFFRARNYFGLDPTQVMFFQQGSLPCFTTDGKIILETECKVAMAPDGNGGVYSALRSSGCLADMEARGVQFLECFSVDNALARVADPVFLGYCLDKGADCAAKAVAKAHPDERVGLFVRGRGGGSSSMEVVEYSEIPPALATSVDPTTGRLRFNWSNVCMHLFRVDFLQSVTDYLEEHCVFHVANKSIPSLAGPVKGVKLEQFIFDVFPQAKSMALFEVARAEEFAPVKNAAGSAADSPDTARALVMALHTQWVTAAGGSIAPAAASTTVAADASSDVGDGAAAGLLPSGADGAARAASPASASVDRAEPSAADMTASVVEVSPLVSHSGEGLEEVCRRQVFPAWTQVTR